MKLDTPVRELGPVDHIPLKTAMSAIHPEAWFEDTLRQEAFADYHGQTQSIILLFCDGWPEIKITPRKGWDYFSKQAEPIVGHILRKHYKPGGVVIRAMLARLRAGGYIAPHEDSHPTFDISHRIHVPLVTNDEVDFFVAGQNFHFKEGLAYELSNLDEHSVRNRSSVDRVHFIFDYAVK
ncbi:MAG: aspartyl/asparaginyl beta-hydroxylase domain-containing protein [Alphaproteobacteria bacterium]